MQKTPPWIGHLSEEDLVFLKRFLLAGGTLKDLAAQYGVSYPTVRLRLDRLVEKVKLVDAAPDAGPVGVGVPGAYAAGPPHPPAFPALPGTHRKERGERQENPGR